MPLFTPLRRHIPVSASKLGACLLAIALVATACGDSGDGEPSAGATARGVTGDAVKIGVAIPDLGPAAAISSQFDIGDPEQQIRAVVQAWREGGELPVHGRDLELVFRGYNIFSADDQVGVCNQFVKDDEVFAVIGLRFFNAGAQCVASEQQTPVITLDGAVAEVYDRGWPFYFTVRTSTTSTFRNWVHWADEKGLLEGRTIGVYFESELEGDVDGVLEPELESLGYQITEKIDAGSGQGVGGGARDEVAAQRFKSAGVDLVMPIIGSTQYGSFMNRAADLDYHPTYIDSDFADHTSDAGSSIFPPGEFDGTLAMTGKRVGGVLGGFGPDDATQECVDDFEEFTAEDVSLDSPESAKLDTILAGCDDMAILLRGLEEAGPELTPTTFVGALESIRDLELPGHGRVSYSPDRHDGVAEQRTVQWQSDCECWEALEEFQPLFVF